MGVMVARVILLLESEHGEAAIGPDAADRLSRLGITNVTLARDVRTVAVVVEGWAFDSARGVDALAIVTGDGARGRVLQPVADMAVTPARTERRAP